MSKFQKIVEQLKRNGWKIERKEGKNILFSKDPPLPPHLRHPKKKSKNTKNK